MANEEPKAGYDLVGVGKLAETLKEVLKPFLDPVLSEAGEYVADRIRFSRFQQSLKAARRAEALLDGQRIRANPVPLKILVPILEGAGLEDGEDLVERWACLLASAAAGERVTPLFPAILARMSSVEAKALQWLWKKGQELAATDPLQVNALWERDRWLRADPLAEELGLSAWECQSILDSLHAQRLLEVGSVGGETRIGVDRGSTGRLEWFDLIRLTVLGVEFIASCTGPGTDTTVWKTGFPQRDPEAQTASESE